MKSSGTLNYFKKFRDEGNLCQPDALRFFFVTIPQLRLVSGYGHWIVDYEIRVPSRPCIIFYGFGILHQKLLLIQPNYLVNLTERKTKQKELT